MSGKPEIPGKDGTGGAGPLIVAHRGSSHRAPENTWPAFELAAVSGADGIEMDVRLAADGVPVVFHDATLKRMTGEGASVRMLTAAEMSAVPVGRWFNLSGSEFADPVFEETGAPTLDSVVRRLRGFRGVIYVELKCDAGDEQHCAEAVAGVLSGSPLEANFVVKSFESGAIPHVKRANPSLRTAALFGRSLTASVRKRRLVRDAVDLGVDSLSLHHSLATRKLMKEAEEAGLGVAVWTVDDPSWIRKALDKGIGTLITNRPEEMLARRREVLEALRRPV